MSTSSNRSPWNARGTDNFRPQKTATLLAQRIVSEISEQKLAPGTQLPSERAMLEQFGVARGSLREALRFLEIQGVITMKTGSGGGPYVAEPTSRPLASSVAMALQLRGAPFRDVVEMRLTLEASLAAKAAQRATKAHIAALGESVKRMREQPEDSRAFLAENEVFHSAVADAAGNQVLALISSSLNWIWDGSLMGVHYPAEIRQVVIEAHARIHRAIEEHNSERASAAMSVHLTDYSSYLERHYPHVLDAPLEWSQI